MLAPSFGDTVLVPVGDWHPARFTASLSGTEDFTTEGDRLLEIAARYWSVAEAERFESDPWQAWTIRHVLETYPPDWPVEHLRGQLRYKQVVISLARQNGKSLIGSLLAFYFLALHVRGPRVGSFASIESQAKIVYDRVRFSIDNNPLLKQDFRATATRGIHMRSGAGIYATFPAKEDSVQGEPFSGALYDELHLGLQALWDAIVVGQRARRQAMLVGITTAGDSDSELLLNLYEIGAAAIAGDDERFGFFVWEGADDELTEANVIAANPAVACGRIPLAEVMAEARRMWGKSRNKVIRYTLNRFVQGSESAWISAQAFNALATGGLPAGSTGVVYGIERTPEWEYVTITANVRAGDRLHTEVVAVIEDCSPDTLLRACLALSSRGACTFAMPADTMKPFGSTLRDHGQTVWTLGVTEIQQACAGVAAAVARRALSHAGDPLLRLQSSRAKRRDSGDGWRISRSLTTGDTDAVLSMICGLFVAELREQTTIDLA